MQHERDYPPVTDLVTRARHGDKQAWDAIVERYAPLIWSICRQYRLDDADAQDVGQMVWLHLVDHLDDLRDPAALPGWLATTTRRQCFRLRQASSRFKQVTGPLVDADNMADTGAVEAEHELLLAERHAALSLLLRLVVDRSRAVPPGGRPRDPGLMSALWTLPARQREVLVLQYAADLPANQVAAAAGLSEAAVRSQAALAFSALRAELPTAG